MGKKKDWVEEIGNIELEISYTSGVYDLAFLMGYGWYEEVEKIVEQIKQESREEVLLELLEKKTNYKIGRVDHGYKVTQEYVLVSDIEKELSKLKSKK